MIQDTLNIKPPVKKIIIPKLGTNNKLKALNQEIRIIDPPKKKVVTQEVKIPAVKDTKTHNYNTETAPYLFPGPADSQAVINFYLNIPDYKPKKVLKKKAVPKTLQLKSELQIPIEITPHEHLLYKTRQNDYKELFNANWIMISLIVIFLFLAWIRVFYNKVLKLTVRSAFNSLISNRSFREKNTLTIWGSFILNVFFILSAGFFIYLLFTFYGYRIGNFSGFSTYAVLCLTLLIIYVVKLISTSLVGVIFDGSKSIAEYIHNVFIYNKTLGIFILPFILIVPYIPDPGKEIFLDIGGLLIIIMYLLRLFRGIKLGFKINVSILYMILYLCTLEIFPVMIVYKLFILYTT